MTWALLATQLLNGLQLGVLLFLLSAGLTLVLGIMNFVNLAHGSLYMMGAYFAAALYGRTESFLLAAIGALAGTLALGATLERLVISKLYQRDHLDQVMATSGLILVLNEVVRIVWGVSPMFIGLPEALRKTVTVMGFQYPAYRFLVIAVGLLMGAGLYLLIHRTVVGMLIRAGASNAPMVSALGVNIGRINALVFAAGAGLAGVAGAMAAPIFSVQPGMGESVLIQVLVVIVTGGVGSVRGAFYAALIVGVVDTIGRVLLPSLLGQLFESSVAQAAGPALGSILIYLMMAVVLAVRPKGLFPVKHG